MCGPLYAVPYFINGRVYIICLTPSFQIKGDEMYPTIDRKEPARKGIDATDSGFQIAYL